MFGFFFLLLYTKNLIVQLMCLPQEYSYTNKLMSGQYTKNVLNVGGNNKNITLPPQYKGWHQILLDIDPKGGPDVLCDARELMGLPANEYDAVYCAHNLEHYYSHDVPKVLKGFLHVLKEHGFAEICVPDIDALMKTVVQEAMDIDDFLYQSPMGPITVKDLIYGHTVEIERSANDFFAHKTGFTSRSLHKVLNKCGFPYVFLGIVNFEIRAVAFEHRPTEDIRDLLNIPM